MSSSTRRLLLAVLIACVGGCAAHSHTHVSHAPLLECPVPPPSKLGGEMGRVAEAPAGPLSLDQLLGIALSRHPDLTAAYARVEAARGKVVQAGLYPNPTIGWEADELGHKENGAGEQGPFVEQEIVTHRKLAIAQAAAAEGVVAADWQALTRRFELFTRVRTAYVELYFFDLEAREVLDILDELEKGKKGEPGQPDRRGFLEITRANRVPFGFEQELLRVEAEMAELRLRLESIRARERAAVKTLGATVGFPELMHVQLVKPTRGNGWAWQDLVSTVKSRSSEIQEAYAQVRQAEGELARAHVERVPNVHVKLRPFRSFPEDDTRLMVEASLPLPIFNANQGNILSAQAMLVEATANASRVELKLIERLAQAFARYETAERQVTRYRDDILPRLRDSARLAYVVYDKSRAEDLKPNFMSALEASRALTQARFAFLQAQLELWRAVLEIEGMLQNETQTLRIEK